jgi:hypothetical protein
VIEARQLPEEIPDVGADPEIVELAGVDADAHGEIITGPAGETGSFGHLVIWLSGYLVN